MRTLGTNYAKVQKKYAGARNIFLWLGLACEFSFFFEQEIALIFRIPRFHIPRRFGAICLDTVSFI